MTYKEVKKARENPTAEDVDNKELSKLIDEALEKQIPKKPQNIGEELFCVCGRYLLHNSEVKYLKYPPEFCYKCGQALDWSE